MKVELRMAKLFQSTQLNGTSETPISNLTLLCLLPQEAKALPCDSHRWHSQDIGLTRLPKILHGNGTEPGLHLLELTW